MPRLDYQTAGESHGPALVVTVTGLPAGVPVDESFINAELGRRQGGYGRGGRQGIEDDKAGSDFIVLSVRNKDFYLCFLPQPDAKIGHVQIAVGWYFCEFPV
jgi:hypothetical protein